MNRYETDLSNQEWSVIQPLILLPSKMGSPRKLDMLAVFNTIQDRDDALVVILSMLAKVPDVERPRVDCGHAWRRPSDALKASGVDKFLEIIQKLKDVKGFTVLYCHRVVEWTFLWMFSGRCLAKDFEWPCEFHCMGAACGMPVHDAVHCAEYKAMKNSNIISLMTYDSYTYFSRFCLRSMP
ncbi:MAG: hypothetical protein OXC62_10165 [Aestuariivita sp.]|nr:hypothetical protein [Aestuariivita sp.]